MQIVDLRLSSFVLDGSHPSMYRDRIGSPDDREAAYDDQYDFHTLIYDCFHDPGTGEVLLLCPSLNNFERLIEETSWSIDGKTCVIEKIDSPARGNIVRFRAPSPEPREMRFNHALFSGSLPINSRHHDLFAGLNALQLVNRESTPEQIRDWLTYYTAEHGANAAVIHDCRPGVTSTDDIEQMLASVPGLQVAALGSARFRFGPDAPGKANFDSKFLQMNMVELGRLRLLGRARAVLNMSTDELVYSRHGQSIFDATVASEKGYVRIDGKWAFADPAQAGQPARHADHLFTRVDGRPSVNRKYCVVPDGPLKGQQWLTHRIISRRDPTDPDFGFWRMHQIAPSAERDMIRADARRLAPNADLERTLSRVFGNKTQSDITRSRPPAVARPKRPTNGGAGRMAKKPLVITAMKNEGPYILEWVAYHRLIGFTDFLVYTNDCSDGTDLILDRMAELGVLTHERNEVLLRGPQKSALKWAYEHPLTAEADWILVSDVDEFLNIKAGQGKLDDLLAAVPFADVIPVTWRLFSNDQRVAFSENLVMADYTDAELSVDAGGQKKRFVKSIFRHRPEITRFGTHGPIHEGTGFDAIRWIAPDGGIVDPERCTRPKNHFAYEVAQINHYATRAVDTYLVKKDRGRVNHYRQDMGMDYWQKMNKGGETDTSIARWIAPTRAEMGRIAEDRVLSDLLATSVDWHRKRIAELHRMPQYRQLYQEILGAEPIRLAS